MLDMNVDQIKIQLDAYIAKHGPWTAHPIKLAEGIDTMGASVNANQVLYLHRILQSVADLARKPLNALRILDLGALEGQFAIEFALQGASVVAVEGRKSNCDRIRFAADLLGLKNLDIIESDVRVINKKVIGSFDVVLCLGLYYHIDKESILPFSRLLFELTENLCVIDTHIAFNGRHDLEGYKGDLYWENQPESSDQQVEENNWSCLSRLPSFFFTDASFRNLISDLGFSSLHVSENPYYRIMSDRRTFIAVKGQSVSLKTYETPSPVHHPNEACRVVVEPINSPDENKMDQLEQKRPASFFNRWWSR